MIRKLEELQVYQLAMDLGERIWELADSWDYFPKDTIGKQLVRAADSIAANIGEGYGRFFYKESKQFYYYSRGSLFETRVWIQKACKRKLISDEETKTLIEMTEILGKKINNFIKSVGNTTM